MATSEVDACMEILRDGIQKHQLLIEELPELIESLERNEDFISDELGFELVAGRLHVTLHDSDAWCDPGDFLAALRTHGG
jgi:uncharacterized protein YabN with tetrapyrrole methylase and pyrophosphatase domain